MKMNASKHVGTCRCGQLRAECEGEPVRVSVCHCLDCQKRSGSAFAAQARWPDQKVRVTGEAKTWTRVADSGHRATYRFCPNCGSTVAYVIEGWPGVTAVPLGAFADPQFPAPKFSVYEHRKHSWTAVLGDDVEHSSTPSARRALEQTCASWVNEARTNKAGGPNGVGRKTEPRWAIVGFNDCAD